MVVVKDTADKPATLEAADVDRRLILVLSVACALAVANLYYNQPLLASIARSFGVPEAQAGIVPTLTQIGYATGLCLIVPLGDLLERRRLVLTLLALVGVSLVAVALAPTLPLLTLASFVLGVTTVVPQVLLPFAAQLAPPAQRGKTVGTVMGGLLIGILLSRTVSGLIAASLGWHAVYWIAAVVMVALGITLRFLLPINRQPHQMSYDALLLSVVRIAREQPVLREAALCGALLFGAFSVFWATLIFQLSSSAFHMGEREAGLFGLVGAVGAAAAPIAGRLADRRSPRFLVGAAGAITFASFLIFLTGTHSIWGLILGVIALDLGVQFAQVTNLARIYSLVPDASSRLNMFYMTSYFIGGAAGSALASFGWAQGKWPGVCIVGMVLSGAAVLVNTYAAQRDRRAA